MTLPTEVNLLLAGSQEYRISRSVRLRAAASASLNRTPSVASNRTTWTWSGWVKRGSVTGTQNIFGARPSAGGTPYTLINFTTANIVAYSDTGLNLTTNGLYRDPSAWYHIVWSIDTTQATAANRASLYVNGVQITSFATATYPAQNTNLAVNSTTNHYLGINPSSAQYFDGYITEVNFIDGQALTPSSFGQIDLLTGVWQPKKYAGTYGTNGFYVNFSDNSAATAAALGKDYSGNGNNWTPTNISVTAGVTYDSMLDVPTPWADGGNGRGNYCVLNPNATLGNGTVSDANLSFVSGVATTWKSAPSSMFQTSGKFYYEATVTGFTSPTYSLAGVVGLQINNTLPTTYAGAIANGWVVQATASAGTINKYNNAVLTAVSNASITAGALNDVYQIAVDVDAGKIWFGKNNVWIEGSPSAGTTSSYTITPQPLSPAVSCYSNAGDKLAVNFGQRPFTYTPPTGFVALNTQNLSTLDIKNGAAYITSTLYTGNGATQSINNTVNGVSFQPDLVWIKSRSAATDHSLYDFVRGVTLDIASNTTAAETTQATGLTAFNTDGFTVGALAKLNTNAATYVAWQWKANGAIATNTAGSITSQVSANVSAGFSVVTYTGTGANASVGHGLGVAPKMVIVKLRSAVQNWGVYHASIGNTGAVFLNLTNATDTNIGYWNNTSPTSTVFSIGTGGTPNTNAGTYVAYCFAAVAGYSAFGTYTGNGLADGPFINVGFKPAFLMLKSSSAVETWLMLDDTRNTFNPETLYLQPNAATAEATATIADFLSNGFKLRIAGASGNASAATYIYAAFAENPFKYALAR